MHGHIMSGYAHHSRPRHDVDLPTWPDPTCINVRIEKVVRTGAVS